MISLNSISWANSSISPESKKSSQCNTRLNVSLRLARAFRCKFSTDDQADTISDRFAVWSVDECSAPKFGRFVIFCEESSLFTVIIPTGKKRKIDSVLEAFQRRRQLLAQMLNLPGFDSLASPSHFFKRTNRRIIGSQNDLIYMFYTELEDYVPPLNEMEIAQIEQRVNATPMSFLGMDSPQFALFGFDKID
jgi:hypothetical protein